MKKLNVVAVVLVVLISFSVIGCSEMSDSGQKSYSVEGIVEDQTGQGVANAQISYKTAQDSGVVTTNKAGKWQISNLKGITQLELKDSNLAQKTVAKSKQNIKFIKKSTSKQESSLLILSQSVIKKSLLKVKENSLIFKRNASQLTNLSSNQVIGIKKCDKVPTGLARKVTSIVNKDKYLVIKTTELTKPLSKQQKDLKSNSITIASLENNLKVLSPQYATVGEAVTFNGSTAGKGIWSGGIYRIVFTVDGYVLGTAHPSGGKYNFSYTFTHAGSNRKLVATAYNIWWHQVAKVSKTITIKRDLPQQKLKVDCPTKIKVGKNATFSGTAPRNVNKVILSVDGYKIGEAQVRNGQYSLDYSFYQGGQNRRLVVNAFDIYGRSVNQITEKIDVAAKNNYSPPKHDYGVKLNVPYYYQLNNTYEPYRTCNITSVAMALSYKTINIDPDTIHRRFGPVFTGYDMQYIARYYGASNTTYHAGASVSQIKNYLDRGIPVIFQGQFTSSGHIIVLIGYDETGWFVHDPYGEWYSWGYQHTPTAGKGEHYSYGLIERQSLGAYHVTAVY